MSYEPQLIIIKHDLKEKENKLSPDNEVDQYLQSVLGYNSCWLLLPNGIHLELVTCRPELTSFNERVRDRLHELDIEFGEDN